MKRQLPVLMIKGTAFYVDVLNDELRERDDPSNRIPFGVFDQEGDGYTFLYDRRLKNIPANRKSLKKMEPHYCWVTVPALMELDLEGIALKYDIPLEILSPEKYSEGKSNPELEVNDEEEDDSDYSY